MNKCLKLMATVIIGISITAITGCGSGEKSIDGVSGKVTKVKNGNTIELSNGLTVHLLGIPSTSQTQAFLKDNALNNMVTLKADRKSAKPKTYKRYNEHVWVYVRLRTGGKLIPLNGYMIRNGVCEADIRFVGDSISSFSRNY